MLDKTMAVISEETMVAETSRLDTQGMTAFTIVTNFVELHLLACVHGLRVVVVFWLKSRS
jgi:hypothetical protein